MMWLEKLDARAARWPTPVYWTYLAVKWYLVFVGAVALSYAMSQNTINRYIQDRLPLP